MQKEKKIRFDIERGGNRKSLSSRKQEFLLQKLVKLQVLSKKMKKFKNSSTNQWIENANSSLEIFNHQL